MYDLLVVNGTIIDGSGAPRFAGNVAVTDGKIVGVGDVDGSARTRIDATGKVVSPGFIDIHTHYDVQVFWDHMLSVSPWHGVTTVVMGNCGFGIAPTRKQDREFILKNLQHVEGMPFATTSKGIGDWGFESFREYLDLIERLGVAVNVAVLVGHTPIRVAVMGEDSIKRAATPDEVEQMRNLVREALEAGAIGFSTSKTRAHTGEGGVPVPSRFGTYEETAALASVLGELGVGTFQPNMGPDIFPHQVEEIIRKTGVRVCQTAIYETYDADEEVANSGMNCRELVDVLDRVNADGFEWRFQAGALPNTFEVSLVEPFMFALDLPKAAMRVTPLEDLFVPIMDLETQAERKVFLSEPTFRDRFREATDREDWNTMYWPWVVINYAPSRPEVEGKRLVAVASDLGLHPSELMLDLTLESDLEARFGVETSFRNAFDKQQELIQNPHVVLGLSDAGAHMSQLCDARYPTNLLGYWSRERGIPLERAVKMLTFDEAEAYGILGRGLLKEGYNADLCVFDPETVIDGPLKRVNDLPAEGRRIISTPVGIEYVIVNGTIIRHDNVDQVGGRHGDLPGKVLREFKRYEASTSAAR